MSKILSIIIPYYEAKRYTDELLACLDKQMTDEIEVILVDDGSPTPFKTEYEWCTVIRQKNKRCAGARNTGLKKATGKYIQFIDADDMVPDYFVSRILREIKENPFDVCDHSWKSLDHTGVQHNMRIKDREGRLPNPSVCTRAFSKAYIGATRFNEKKDSTEDEDFSRKLGYLDKDIPCKHTAISDYMYYYRTSVENSKVKRFKAGLMNTKRIVYYYSHVTADMKSLLEEIKAEDQTNEVWLLTNQCDIPGLKRYCQIAKPMTIWAHELRGESYGRCTVIEPPIRTQIVIYCEFVSKVGGITTFIYNFCQHMKEYYDIVVMIERIDAVHAERLSQIVRLEKYDPSKSIYCDTLILNRLTDKIPSNVICKQTIQICHACRQVKYRIPQDRDYLINVSEAAKKSWGKEAEDGIVIHNISFPEQKPCLMLISATRVKTTDKGQNDIRMKKLAQMLDEAQIKYLWLNFADSQLSDMPRSFVNMPATTDIQPYIAKADYLVQLSDTEAFCYSAIEALENGTPVIITPLSVLPEIGIEDGVNGYVVPFDMKFDVRKLLEIPQFEYEYDNTEIIKKWRKILGSKKPERKYIPPVMVDVICLYQYFDTELKRTVKKGEKIRTTEERAQIICKAGYGRRG